MKLHLLSFLIIILLVFSNAEARFDNFALVITNDTYERCKAIPYTQNDGDAMEAFLNQIPGLSSERNIIRKRNANIQWFNSWFGIAGSKESYLGGYLSQNPSEVWIYYSGHGGTDGTKTYLLPVDMNPDQMTNSSYALDTLVGNIKNIGISKVYLIIDACYGGQSATGNVRKDGKPFEGAYKVPEKIVNAIPSGIMLMQSCIGKQISWDYKDAMSLFTYSLLKNWWEKPHTQVQADTLLKDTSDFIMTYCVQQEPPKNLQEPWFSDTDVTLPVPNKSGDLSKWAKAPAKPREVVSQGLSGQAYRPIVENRKVPELPSSGTNPPSVRQEGTWGTEFSRSEARRGIAFNYFGTDDGGIAKYRWKLNDDDSQETVGLRVTLDNLPAGYHTLQVQAIDYDGSISKPIKHQFLVRGNEPPKAKLLSPTGDTARGKTLSIKVDGTDPDGKITTYRAAVGSTKNLQSNTSGKFDFECAGGRQKIYAQVVDDEGAVSDWVESQVDYTFDEGYAGNSGNEIARDGRFIAYDNGTVLDTSTNLMWAAKDNGSDINWADAKRYCENYRGGGYTDWRMPTKDELLKIYGTGEYSSPCNSKYTLKINKLIRLSCFWVWASEKKGSEAARVVFYYGHWSWRYRSYSTNCRALPVRVRK